MLEDKIIHDDSEDVVNPQMSNDVDDIDDVDDTDIGETNADAETEGENEEVAEPQKKQTQSVEENSQYKKMRLKAKEEAQREVDEQRQELQRMKMEIEQQKSEQKILSEYLNTDKVYEYADKEGISEEQAKKILALEAKNIIHAEKAKVVESFERLQKVKSDLSKKDRHFKALEPKVDALLKHNPDADYMSLYYYQKGIDADELLSNSSKSKEKQTVANMHDRARRKSVSGSDGSDETMASASMLTQKGLAVANAFGVDPREVAKYVKKTMK